MYANGMQNGMPTVCKTVCIIFFITKQHYELFNLFLQKCEQFYFEIELKAKFSPNSPLQNYPLKLLCRNAQRLLAALYYADFALRQRLFRRDNRNSRFPAQELLRHKSNA